MHMVPHADQKTNNLLERWHRILKENYLNWRQHIRLDKLVHCLLRISVIQIHQLETIRQGLQGAEKNMSKMLPNVLKANANLKKGNYEIITRDNGQEVYVFKPSAKSSACSVILSSNPASPIMIGYGTCHTARQGILCYHTIRIALDKGLFSLSGAELVYNNAALEDQGGFHIIPNVRSKGGVSDESVHNANEGGGVEFTSSSPVGNVAQNTDKSLEVQRVTPMKSKFIDIVDGLDRNTAGVVLTSCIEQAQEASLPCNVEGVNKATSRVPKPAMNPFAGSRRKRGQDIIDVADRHKKGKRKLPGKRCQTAPKEVAKLVSIRKKRGTRRTQLSVGDMLKKNREKQVSAINHIVRHGRSFHLVGKKHQELVVRYTVAMEATQVHARQGGHVPLKELSSEQIHSLCSDKLAKEVQAVDHECYMAAMHNHEKEAARVGPLGRLVNIEYPDGVSQGLVVAKPLQNLDHWVVEFPDKPNHTFKSVSGKLLKRAIVKCRSET